MPVPSQAQTEAEDRAFAAAYYGLNRDPYRVHRENIQELQRATGGPSVAISFRSSAMGSYSRMRESVSEYPRAWSLRDSRGLGPFDVIAAESRSRQQARERLIQLATELQQLDDLSRVGTVNPAATSGLLELSTQSVEELLAFIGGPDRSELSVSAPDPGMTRQEGIEQVADRFRQMILPAAAVIVGVRPDESSIEEVRSGFAELDAMLRGLREDESVN